MATLSYTATKQVNDGATTITKPVVIAAQSDLRIENDLGIVTNSQLAFAFTRSKLALIFIVADQAMTIKTNSSGSPQETITLVAGQPFTWDSTDGSVVSTRFAGDVTTIYVTTTVATHLSIRALVTE